MKKQVVLFLVVFDAAEVEEDREQAQLLHRVQALVLHDRRHLLHLVLAHLRVLLHIALLLQLDLRPEASRRITLGCALVLLCIWLRRQKLNVSPEINGFIVSKISVIDSLLNKLFLLLACLQHNKLECSF